MLKNKVTYILGSLVMRSLGLLGGLMQSLVLLDGSGVLFGRVLLLSLSSLEV